MNKNENEVNLVDVFAEFREEKKLDRKDLIKVIEDSCKSALSKMFGSDENFQVIVNPDKGDWEIIRSREVVPDGEVTDKNKQVALSEAQKTVDDIEVGEDFVDKIDFQNFGRRTVLNLRQTLMSKILDHQSQVTFEMYSKKVGDIVSGEVYQVWKKEVLIMDDEENEMLLPKTEQIPTDFFRKGDTVLAIVARVDNNNGKPKIYLSRTSEVFLEKLLERDVPEIADGLITIKKIVRAPGERAKVAVESYDDRIDPVGACVGIKGARIHGVVRELHNENIDVINYTTNTSLYISRALSPAKITSIQLDTENKKASVFLRPEEISFAIGKAGQNIKLASKLTGYTIDVFRDEPVEDAGEDIAIEEFNDEIDDWVIDALKAIGCDTAKSVLNIPREDLIERTDLEEETIDHVLKVIRAEFDNDAAEHA